MNPQPGQRILWGKERTVKKYYVPTNWVYFTDGSSARWNPRTMTVLP